MSSGQTPGTTPLTGCSAATNATRTSSARSSTSPTPSSPSAGSSARHGSCIDGMTARPGDHDDLPIRAVSKPNGQRTRCGTAVRACVEVTVGNGLADVVVPSTRLSAWRRSSPGGTASRCGLPGGARDVRGDDVGGMPVQAAPGPPWWTASWFPGRHGTRPLARRAAAPRGAAAGVSDGWRWNPSRPGTPLSRRRRRPGSPGQVVTGALDELQARIGQRPGEPGGRRG
jgi:hypothetical protein